MKLYRAAYIALAAPPAAAVYIPIPSKPLCVLPCPSAAICIADPNPRCVIPNGFCGGFAALTCEAENEYCVDDPTDDCAPGYGGWDCGGVCVKKPTNVTSCASD